MTLPACMTPKVEWSQIATEQHPAGIRLECPCGYVEYFGDSPAGDLKMHEAKMAHVCPDPGDVSSKDVGAVRPPPLPPRL